MNKRWYFFGLLVALAFFGISVEQSAVPNQEIVVQFNAKSINSEEAQRAISEVTDQLKSIGISDFQVSEALDGTLKVTYYSTIDVAVIKNLFSRQNKLQFGETAFNKRGGSSKIPFHNDSNTYKLEVVKIQDNSGSDVGFHGLPVEIKSLKDQYVNQHVFLGISEIAFGIKNTFERKTAKNYYALDFSKDTASHKIPEVRAGPVS